MWSRACRRETVCRFRLELEIGGGSIDAGKLGVGKD
jgi:hypothetical protein